MNDTLMQNMIRNFINYLPYAMGVVFLVSAGLRGVIYYTVRRHEWFAREFEKKVHRFLDSEENKNLQDASFYVLCKKMFEKTYYDAFASRKKSNDSLDHVMSVNDRIFLVKPGCAWLVKDVLKQLRYLKWSKETPKLQNITRATLHHNPCFNNVFGILPMSAVNDIISIMPGLFVVAGILGTFLGIKGGLVQLGGMDIANLEQTKTLMDSFLHEIGFAMASSIVGIAFSLCLHLLNVSMSPERVFTSLVDRFESSMDLLWYRSDNNIVPEHDAKFNENRDPMEALAEEAVNIEVIKSKKELRHAA